ncbi:MAG: T9SS type A sorting domain-containing protein [Melioribacteraceae bacterium]|nr:T9SS type A sorting domain-containing protein [Melioribacteraceae bacterium]MCF8395308.1 T9SS type A sorting domain-containing protein [Melioribacteraceae bacterium]MCF8420330.1 T9SS type A sorting domain-containing protein [Melioribacteraceae bacterium]
MILKQILPVFLIALFLQSYLIAQQQNYNPQFNQYKNHLPDYYNQDYAQYESRTTFDDSMLTLAGRWTWGECSAVEVKDNYAYIGNGQNFQVLDISAPSNPNIIGEFWIENYIYEIRLLDTIAVVCRGGGLHFIDISDPDNPGKISEISLSGGPINLAVSNNFAYVSTISGHMLVVDFSDIQNPVKRGFIPVGGERANCIAVKENSVYVGNPEISWMYIVDVSNPDSLSRNEFYVDGSGFSACLKDSILFIGIHGSGTNYLKIYNVSLPNEPTLLGQVEIESPEDFAKITCNDDISIIFTGTDLGQILSIDISDIYQPEIMDSLMNPMVQGISSTGLTFSENVLLSSFSNGFFIIDASDPEYLNISSFFPTGGYVFEVETKENLAFITCGFSGLWILDCTLSTDIQPVSNINTTGSAVNLLIDDTLAYVYNQKNVFPTDSTDGLWIININDPKHPEILSHYKARNDVILVSSITKSDNFLIVTQVTRTENDTLLEIIDVTDPQSPEFVSCMVGNYHTFNTAIKDTILYLATSNRGLRILNIKDPSYPNEVNVFQDSTHILGIEVDDSYAYADRLDTLFILNISDPINPSIIGRMGRSLGGFSSLHTHVYDDFYYWANGYFGVVDISDRTNPIELSLVEDNGSALDVCNIYENLIVTRGYYGIWILKNNLISKIKLTENIIPNEYYLYQNYPNPFNNQTVIKFYIPKQSFITIELFDLLGRKIGNIAAGVYHRGMYKIRFDSNNLCSGIYFYKMTSGDIIYTKKFLILK